ncbi:hypothetical protein TNCV_4457261 [Trichonephila clavipes]|nr:hypothetical protein TNCV_4457261 [Trichonephila clavipes]
MGPVRPCHKTSLNLHVPLKQTLEISEVHEPQFKNRWCSGWKNGKGKFGMLQLIDNGIHLDAKIRNLGRSKLHN